MAGKLTALKVKALTKPGRYGDGGGLWLQVRGPSQRSWLFRFAIQGKQQQMGLGSIELVTLAEAREVALNARRLLLAGKNPLKARRDAAAAAAAEKPSMTFKAVSALYIAAHEPTWRNAQHKYQWRATLETYVNPVMGETPIAAVDTGAVIRVLEPIWLTKPETAARVRGRIETVLDYASARGWRAGDNPARWRGHVSKLLPPRARVAKVKHHSALPWHEVGAFMAVLAQEGGVAALALRFTILTAARTTEAIESRWSEIDLDKNLWTVPADRMKAGREHRVPLSGAVVALLQPLKSAAVDDQCYVFPSKTVNKPLSNMAMTALLRRMSRGDITVHGFRSTFRDWVGEATGYARELAETALAHTLKDKTEAAYSRGDALEKRRRLMEDWATFCGRSATTDADVVPIRARG